MMRGIAVAFFLTFAAILSLLSNVGLWVDRTVYDTDTFVATTDDVLDDEDVQQVLAERFTEELFVAADVDARLETELPEGLKFLSLPLGRAAEDFLRDATLRLLERQPFEDVRNEALRRTHARLIAIIEDESGTVSTEGDELVLDLRPVLEGVAQDVTGRDVNLPQQGGAEIPEIPEDVLERLPPEARERLEQDGQDGLLARLELPEDAGRFVIEDASVAWAYNIARYGNDIVYAVIGITVACYALAILVARDRRGTLLTGGVVLAASGVLSLALLLPVEYATRTFAKNDAAATSIVDIVTRGFKEQSLIMIVGGVGIAGVAALMGESRLAVAIRGTFRRTPEAPSLAAVIRERAAVLRIAGLLCAALLLIIWPDPTARVYVTTIGLLGVYLLAVFVVASDAGVAVRVRREAERLWDSQAAARPDELAEHSLRASIGAYAGWLRLGGIIVAVGLLLLWPSVNLRFFVMVVALSFIYLAMIDLAGARAGKPSDEAHGQPRT